MIVAKKDAMKKQTKPGVLLTFDDVANIDCWHDAIDLFSEFDAKATFFINAPDQLNDLQWKKLDELIKRGHDVGCHGWHHEKAVDYCNAHSLQEWMDDEVLSVRNMLRDHGFNATSFAYPCSQNDQNTDDALKQYFNHARTGVALKEGQKFFYELDEIFTPIEKISDCFLLPGKSIDNLGDISQIEGAFERAAKQSEIVVLYGHSIDIPAEGKAITHITDVRFLRQVLAAARSKELEFYTYSDLPAQRQS